VYSYSDKVLGHDLKAELCKTEYYLLLSIISAIYMSVSIFSDVYLGNYTSSDSYVVLEVVPMVFSATWKLMIMLAFSCWLRLMLATMLYVAKFAMVSSLAVLVTGIQQCSAVVYFANKIRRKCPLGVFFLAIWLLTCASIVSAGSDFIDVGKIAAQFTNEKFVGGNDVVKVWTNFVRFSEKFVAVVNSISCQLLPTSTGFSLTDVIATARRIPADCLKYDMILYSALLAVLGGEALDVARRVSGNSGRAVWKALKRTFARSNPSMLASFQSDCCSFSLSTGHPGSAIDALKDKMGHLDMHKCGLSDNQKSNILVSATSAGAKKPFERL
jgi:hypothetical protein